MVSRETSLREEVIKGVKQTWAVGLGLIPLGLAFGLLITQSGFAWWWAPIFSLVIYAGSMEFLAIGLITGCVGPISAAVTGFMVNFRHIFYGLTFPRHAIHSRIGRAYSTYALTDESYAIVSADPERHPSGAKVLTVQILCQLLWVIPGTIAALIGQALPDNIRGMEFALTALFVVLAWESFKANRDYSLPIIAGGMAIATAFVAPAHILIVSLTLYFIVLLIRNASPRVDEALTWRIGAQDAAGGAEVREAKSTKEGELGNE